MKRLLKLSLVVVMILPFFQFSPIAKAASEPTVTVELRNYIRNKTSLHVNVVGEYKTGNLNNDRLIDGVTSFTLKVENNRLAFYVSNSRKGFVEGNLSLTPVNYANSYVQITGDEETRRYRGSFEFKIESGLYVRPINKLPLEDYIKGVVPREMPASWGIEALKAQSVAARTYVAKHSYKVNDTQSNQVYGGIELTSYQQKISDVVDTTKGKILKIGSAYADTVFTSSNGGYTESNDGAWGYTALSYLPAKADPYDPKHRWDIRLQATQISLDGLDLKKPEAWWNFVQETNTIARYNMKPWLKSQLKLPASSDLKILSIDQLTIHPERTPGNRMKSGTVKIRYVEKSGSAFVKDAQGNLLVKTYQPAMLTSNQLRSMLGTVNMKSSLVDTIAAPTSTEIARINGAERIATSVQISKELYPNGFPADHSFKTVFIATGYEYADALSAGPLAYQYGNAPILLTKSEILSSDVIDEIKRLNATDVVVLGGETAVSDEVVNQLKQISMVNDEAVTRISGVNRYQTNAEINKRLLNVNGLFIASGQNFADALAGSSVAAINQYAIVLTNQASLPADSQAFIETHSSKPSYVLGGENAVSTNVVQKLQQINATISRLSGADRYQTLAKILTTFSTTFNGSEVLYSTGSDFPDALTSSSLAAAKKAPVILVGNGISSSLESFLASYKGKVNEIHVLGGQVAVSDSKVTQLKDSLGVVTSIHLSGTGFGHGVGMSQYGAQKQASLGVTYDRILEFYYPGTTLSSLY